MIDPVIVCAVVAGAGSGAVIDLRTGSQEAAEQLYERAARSNPAGRMSRDDDYAAVVERNRSVQRAAATMRAPGARSSARPGIERCRRACSRRHAADPRRAQPQ